MKVTTLIILFWSVIFFTSAYGKGIKGYNDLTDTTAIINKFQLVCKRFGNIKDNYTLGGVISIKDASAPANSLPFLFCKHGDEFYYSLGQTITINENGKYLYIDKNTKSIIVSPQKKLTYSDGGLQQFTKMAENIKSENYQISSSILGEMQTISLVNEHHISCKQYTITFNRTTLKVNHLYMRLTNINAPQKSNDKIVDVAITQWINTADLQNYLSTGKVIISSGGVPRGVNEYKNYKIIQM